MRDTAEGETHSAPEPDAAVLAAVVVLIKDSRSKEILASTRDPLQLEGYVRGFLLQYPVIAECVSVRAAADVVIKEWKAWDKTPELLASSDLINSLHDLVDICEGGEL